MKQKSPLYLKHLTSEATLAPYLGPSITKDLACQLALYLHVPSLFPPQTTLAGENPHSLNPHLVPSWTNHLISSLLHFAPIPLFSWTYFFFSHNYSSFPYHQPTDSTCLHNCFLPSASLDFFESFLLMHMYFFMIPSHSINFHLLCHCSGPFQVSGI